MEDYLDDEPVPGLLLIHCVNCGKRSVQNEEYLFRCALGVEINGWGVAKEAEGTATYRCPTCAALSQEGTLE